MITPELRLRQMLWLRHGCDHAFLYGDDGEMQCHNCGLDFRRHSEDRICDTINFVALYKFYLSAAIITAEQYDEAIIQRRLLNIIAVQG